MNATPNCRCGCGQPAPIAPQTDKRHGYIEGQPVRYIRGHNKRIRLSILDRIHMRSRAEETPRSAEIGDCLIWTGARNPSGYGAIRANGKTYEVHRAAWIGRHGEPPVDKPWVLHRCDNRPCFRDDHLFLGTHEDNMADAVAKRKHCKHGHPFDQANTYHQGNGRRGCRACNRASAARYAARRKVVA